MRWKTLGVVLTVMNAAIAHGQIDPGQLTGIKRVLEQKPDSLPMTLLLKSEGRKYAGVVSKYASH